MLPTFNIWYRTVRTYNGLTPCGFKQSVLSDCELFHSGRTDCLLEGTILNRIVETDALSNSSELIANP